MLRTQWLVISFVLGPFLSIFLLAPDSGFVPYYGTCSLNIAFCITLVYLSGILFFPDMVNAFDSSYIRTEEDRRRDEIIKKDRNSFDSVLITSILIGFIISLIVFNGDIIGIAFGTFGFAFLVLFPLLDISARYEVRAYDNKIIYCKYCKKSLKRKNNGHESFQSRHCTSEKSKEYRIANSEKKSKTAKATISAKKAAEKRKKTKRENEKNRKIAAFNNRIFQQGYANPSMTKKESVWIESKGKCISCKNKRKGKLGFWWRIYPSLDLVLLCDKCAKDEGLIEEPLENNEKRSRTITEDVKDSVWRRDEGKCTQCGSNENLEFDHIIPHSKGGANTKRNIQLLCEPCNRKKSDNIG